MASIDAQSPRYFIFTVDTESDAPLWRDHHHSNLTFNNCQGLPSLLRLCENYGVKPTFLVTHAMAGQPSLSKALEPFLAKSLCEVGAHFHPGDTPPFTGGGSGDNVLRVSNDLLHEKFTALHNQISSTFGRPASFRCGAWTIDQRVIRLLVSFGYIVDSSVTPSISWRLIGRPDYLNAPTSAYNLDYFDPAKAGATPILEAPVTIWTPIKPSGPLGFIDGTFFSMPLESKTGFFFQYFKLLRHNKPLWLRPAFSTLGEMIFASRNVFEECDYIHVMCHSNELTQGTSPYSITKEKSDIIQTRLKLFFSYAREKGYIPCTLSEYVRMRCPQPPEDHRDFNQGSVELATSAPVPSKACVEVRTHRAASNRPGIIKIAVTAGILGVVCLKVNVTHLWSVFSAAHGNLLVAAVLLTMLTHSINAFKVKLILPRKTPLRFQTLLNINFLSTFFNNIFPTRFGGDLARILYIGKALSSKEIGLYTVLFDRLTGFLVQTVIVLGSCALLSGNLISNQKKFYCAISAVILIGFAYGFLSTVSRAVLSRKHFRFPFSFINRLASHAEFRTFIQGLFEYRIKHILIHLSGYIFQSFVILTVMALTYAMGGRITFFEAALTLFIGTIACFLPLSIGGWGVMEGVFAFVYYHLHADAGLGLAVSLGLRITSVLPSLIGGFVFLKKNKETV